MSIAGSTFFRDLDDADASAQQPHPFWALDRKNEKDVLHWLTSERDWLLSENEDRFRNLERNLALYKGIQYQTSETRADVRELQEERRRKSNKIEVNHLFDLTQNRSSRLIKFKPAVAILPTNDEFGDKNAARITEDLLKHIWYSEEFEGKISPRVAKDAMILGEAYLFVGWDPDKGDLHPDYKEIEKKGSTTITGENGKKIKIDRPVKVGDVTYEFEMPFNVLLQRRENLDQCNYVFRRRIMPVEELKLLYPDKADEIHVRNGTEIYDFEKMQLRPSRSEVVFWEFYHRRHRAMDKGAYVAFMDGVILTDTDFPFTHRKLPFTRFTDIDRPGELHGVSFYETVKKLTGVYNNLTTMIYRNQSLVAHPKWMVPAGSIRKSQLANDITIVEYKGPTPPVLSQANPTPSEVFNFRNQIKEEFQQISGVFGVSRGEPPAGIKAGVALQFLSEQESERFNELVLKFNEWIKQTAIMTLAVAGDYYESSDQRMIRVVGKEDQWRTMFFDQAVLSKDYDVRIQNSSALPQSKAARIQTLFDLQDRFPDAVDPNQVLELYDFAQSDKFTDIATASIRNAEAENEMIVNGEADEVTRPEDFEDHITHWKTHMQVVNQFSFKRLPKEVKQTMRDHIQVHEMFMIRKAKTNPVFAEGLAALPQFPIFFVPTPTAPEQDEDLDVDITVGTEGPRVGPQPGPLNVPPEQPVRPSVGQEVNDSSLPPVEGQIAAEPSIPPEPPSVQTQGQQ